LAKRKLSKGNRDASKGDRDVSKGDRDVSDREGRPYLQHILSTKNLPKKDPSVYDTFGIPVLFGKSLFQQKTIEK
jgi:hypothetical protein